MAKEITPLAKALIALDNRAVSHVSKLILIDVMAELALSSFNEGLKTADKFKKSPIHDKKAIIEMMDKLTPEKMIKVVEFLKEQITNK